MLILKPAMMMMMKTENSMDDPEAESNLMDMVEEDLDDLMASTAQAGKPTGVDPKHFSKIWRISHEDAKNTIDVTTQSSIQKDNPVLSRNYSTNDRMLRYKRIKDFFFMDTFFATKKGGQSSRGHTCCQLFVTDKGFIYVVPMKRKEEVLLANRILGWLTVNPAGFWPQNTPTRWV